MGEALRRDKLPVHFRTGTAAVILDHIEPIAGTNRRVESRDGALCLSIPLQEIEALMSLLADFESVCMQHRAETNGHALPANIWRERLSALEGIYHRMVHSQEWWMLGNDKAAECAAQVRFTRNQLGLAERRDREP
jgi:hypothetical protein